MKNTSLLLDGVFILNDISLSIDSKGSTVIFGASGSGKTTLLKILCGLIQTNLGEVLFDGQNIGKMTEREFFKMQARSGFVFQDAALWANKSIYDNLAIPIRIMNPLLDKKEIDDRVNSAVGMFNFKDNLMLRPVAISEGEKKIISFLRAIMTDPEILFLDEPTNSMDTKNISRLNAIIKELRDKKKTIITVTHDFRLAKSIADNLILLKDGLLVKSGKYEELVNSDNQNVINIIEDVKGQV